MQHKLTKEHLMTAINPWSTLRPAPVREAQKLVRSAYNSLVPIANGIELPVGPIVGLARADARAAVDLMRAQKNPILRNDITNAREGIEFLDRAMSAKRPATFERNLARAMSSFDEAAVGLREIYVDLTTKAHAMSIIRG